MIIFKKKDHDGEYLQMRIEGGADWGEVTDRFVEFLQGSGYVLQGIDVAEYLMEQYAFQKPQPISAEWVDQPRSEIKQKKGKKNAKQK